MQIDPLEPRVLLTTAISLRSGVLYVHASDAAAIDVTVGYADASKSNIRITATDGENRSLLKSSTVDRVILEGGAGNDSLIFDSTTARFDKPALILGGGGDDTLAGGAADDALIGGAGNDDLTGGKGHDLLLDGSGDDTLTGGAGNDICFGGLGSDQVSGGSGDDNIFSLDGPDTVSADEGNDTITVGESGRSDGGVDDDSSWVLTGSTAVVLGGAGNNQTNPITAGKAGRRLKRQIADVTDAYHLTKSTLQQV